MKSKNIAIAAILAATLMGSAITVYSQPAPAGDMPEGMREMGGCQGEMPDKTFNVKVMDNKGDVVLQKEMKSGRNGFDGVWLPRNMAGTIAVSYNGKKAEYPIKTMEDSQTCLTKLQLR